MSNRVKDVLCLVSGEVLFARDVVVIVRDSANIFHGTHGVVRAEDLIEFVKRVWSVEHLLVEADGPFCDSDPVVLHLLNVLRQRLAAKDAHRNVGKLLLSLLGSSDAVKGTSDEAEQVGGNPRCARKLMQDDLRVVKLSHNR